MQQKTNKTHWYLLYTNPRAEKKAALELQKKGYEVFLPLQKTLKTWSDRKKWVEEPLFKSYLFIETELEANYYTILNTPSIVKFISFQSHPAIVDPREINLVKLLLGDNLELSQNEITETLHPGDNVTIIAGPLFGNSGKLISTRTGERVLIELQSMKQNLLVTLPNNYLNKISNSISQAVYI
jgi:transcriptional antiterminator RfaH